MRSLSMTLFRWLFALTALPEPFLALVANRTIDDTRGDSVTANPVVYQGVWNANACPQCLIEPDPAQAFDGTWTGTTYFQQSQDPVSATLTFTGTAIYIFFILANDAGSGVVSKTIANITLDNRSPLLYEHFPDISSTNLQYNVLVFSQTELENVHHSLVISVSGIQEEVYVNFDYAIYTHEDQVFGPSGEPVSDPTEQPQIVPHTSGSLGPSPMSFTSITAASQSTPQVSGHSASIPVSGSSPLSIPPSDPDETSSAQSTSHHLKANVEVGVILGGCLGGLVVLSFLVFGIPFIWRKRRQRHLDSRMGSADLLDSEDESSGNRIYAGNGNIDQNGVDTTVVPFDRDLPSIAQVTRIKPPEATARDSRDDMPWLTAPSRMPRALREGETVGANGEQRIEGLSGVRQEELDQRLWSLQQEMVEVLNEINNRRASQQTLRPLPIPGQPGQSLTASNHSRRGPSNLQISIEELQDTLRHMRRQLGHLQRQQQSVWTQGSSEGSPPGYTTDTRV